MNRFMITNNSVVNIQNLIMNHKSQPTKLNPREHFWISTCENANDQHEEISLT